MKCTCGGAVREARREKAYRRFVWRPRALQVVHGVCQACGRRQWWHARVTWRAAGPMAAGIGIGVTAGGASAPADGQASCLPGSAGASPSPVDGAVIAEHLGRLQEAVDRYAISAGVA